MRLEKKQYTIKTTDVPEALLMVYTEDVSIVRRHENGIDVVCSKRDRLIIGSNSARYKRYKKR
jgi:hypothetical protein